MTSLVLELQRDALDETRSVSSILRKALVVSRKLEVRDADEWLDRELHGYTSAPDVPLYRQLSGEIRAQHPQQGLIPVLFNETVDVLEAYRRHQVRESVAELERFVAGGGTLRVERAPIAYRSVHFPVYLILQQPAIHGILNAVRNATLEWALALEAKGVLGEKMSFSESEREAARHVQNITNFFGPVSGLLVQQGSNHASVVLAMQVSAVQSLTASLRAQTGSLPPESRDEAEATLAAIEREAASESPSPSKLVQKLKEAAEVFKTGAAAAGAVEAIGKLVAWIAS